MNLLVMLTLTMIAALIQAVVPSSPALGQAKIPALAAIVVYYALARERRDLLMVVIIAGFVQDGMGLIPFGYSPVAFGVMGFMISKCKEIVFVHEVLTHMLFGVLVAAGTTCVLFILLTSTSLIDLHVSQAFHKIAGSALLGAVTTPLVFRGCAHLDRLMGLVESTDSTWQEIH